MLRWWRVLRARSVIGGASAIAMASLSTVTVLPAFGAGFDSTHGAWNALLKEVVVASEGGRSTLVRYSLLKGAPAELDAVLAAYSELPEAGYQALAPDDRLAFLINAYNAFTLKLIIDHYPLKSIRSIGWIFGAAWRMDFFTLRGAKRTLDDLEHRMIRVEFKEPRIHFAVNCASKGCPSLRAEAYVGARLDAQLDEQTRLFLGDPARNAYDPASRTLSASKIFDWYGGDFSPSGDEDGVAAFAARYLPALAADLGSGESTSEGGSEGKAKADADVKPSQNQGQNQKPNLNPKTKVKVKVKWSDYDWGLNDTP